MTAGSDRKKEKVRDAWLYVVLFEIEKGDEYGAYVVSKTMVQRLQEIGLLSRSVLTDQEEK